MVVKVDVASAQETGQLAILEVDRSLVVLKRSMASGCAGIDNPLSSTPSRRCCSATPRDRSARSPPKCSRCNEHHFKAAGEAGESRAHPCW